MAPRPIDPDDAEFVVIPRLEEYYRPRSPVVGWGRAIPQAWRAARGVLPVIAAGLFFTALLLNPPAVF